jgi:acyl carrier protein phosphodiesterase
MQINKLNLPMNFLAHVYLSGENTQLAIGNLIADQVKGESYQEYPIEIQKGIVLHRAIDDFTDRNPIFRSCTSRLFPHYRHYSRVLIDMYFDHYLASLWANYHSKSLNDFSLSFYAQLNANSHQLPVSIQKFCAALIRYNWFEQYQSLEGLESILGQMEKRTAFESNLAASITQLKENYTYFGDQFFSFMEELISFTKTKITTL